MKRFNNTEIFNFSLSITTVIALFASICMAYKGLIPPDPENPGKCVYRGDTLNVGLTNNSAPCQQLTCKEDGSILIEGCGKLRIENCNRGERISGDKPFPECCKLKYQCRKADGSSYFIDKDSSDAALKKENST